MHAAGIIEGDSLSNQSADRPIVLRRETDVGHGERAISLRVALQADTLAFLAAQVGLDL